MSTVDLLRAHAPTASEELHRRVSLLRPAPRRGPRVRPVLVLAAAAAIAILAAVVHGFSTSEPQQRQAHTKQTLTLEHGAAASGSIGAATDQALAVPGPAPGRLQHTDASIRVRVDDVGTATTRATRIATELGGYAQSVQYRTPQNRAAASYIELRIPAQNVKRALAQLGGLGTVVSQQISIEDLTNTVERQSAQIAQLRRRVAALQAALRNPSLPDAQRVLLQIKLAEAKRALAQRLHGRKSTLAAGATSRVSLVLENRKHAAAVAHHRGRLGRMLHSAAGFLALEGIVLLFALIVASPVAISVALLWLWRRRAVDRLLME
jgi:hypothetical protein